MENGLPPWSVVAFVAAFAALWLTIFKVVAHWGGWRDLSATYPSQGEPTGERFRMRSFQLRAGCNYNNCVTLVASPAGLHISMPLPFRFAHPPIFLPWSEIRAERKKVWLVRVVTLTANRCPDVPVKLRPRLAEVLLAAGGAHVSALDADDASW